MASALSRKLVSSFILQNPRNPIQAGSHFRALSPPTPSRPSPNLPSIFDPRLLRSHPISTIAQSKLINPNPNPNPFKSRSLLPQIPPLAARYFSATPKESSEHGSSPQTPELRHQEIVGPTVERDVSPLAEETRQALESMRRSLYDLSSALALFGFAQLGLGAWIAYAVRPPDVVTVQGVAAFGFPFALAFLMRRALKPITFFRKMEEQGRLQILTLNLQVYKNLTAMFLRFRVVSIGCVAVVSAGSVSAILLR